MSNQPQSAEVVIVGAGILGASIAHHLAQRGQRNVVLLEQHPRLGLGSTGKATGGFRAQFGSAIHVRLSLLARQKLLRFQEDTGVDPGFAQRGYLFLAGTEAELQPLLDGQAVQHAEGLTEAIRVGQDDIRRLQPEVRAEDFIGGTFCPTDGFLRPLDILRGYSESAARQGVRIVREAPCTAMRMNKEGRIEAVLTPHGSIAVGQVVNAAGAWAARIAALAGVQIPVTPLRRQLALSDPTDLLPVEMPMTLFSSDWLHLRVRDGGVLLGLPDEPRTTDPYDTRLDEDWLAEVVSRARQRVPKLELAHWRPENAWGGLYEVSPDRHTLLGAAPGVPNLFLANGASGHGVMHSPAIGQLLAEVLLDGQASTLDITALRPSRFAEGRPNLVEFL